MSLSIINKLKIVSSGVIYLFTPNFGILGLFNVVKVRFLALYYSLFGEF